MNPFEIPGINFVRLAEHFDLFCQVAIAILGGLGVYLAGRRDKYQKWGYAFGLMSQPFWLYVTWTAGQWALVSMTLWYTFSWGTGFYNHWIRKSKKEERLNEPAWDYFTQRHNKKQD